jgi:hypothetical protein
MTASAGINIVPAVFRLRLVYNHSSQFLGSYRRRADGRCIAPELMEAGLHQAENSGAHRVQFAGNGGVGFNFVN